MRKLLSLLMLFTALAPLGAPSIRQAPTEEVYLVEASGTMDAAAAESEPGDRELPEESQGGGDDPAVMHSICNALGELSVPHYHEYLILPPTILGYPPLFPPDGARA